MEPDETTTHEPTLAEAGEQLRGDFEMMRQVVTDKADQLRQTVTTLVDEHPIATVAGAFGIGYLLSGALYSKTTARLFGVGARLLVGAMVKQAVAGGGLGFMSSILRDGEPGSPAKR